MVKLYLPYGNLKDFKGHSQVTLHWFVKDREQPVAPYAQLVENYRHLSGEDQRRAERIIDELFTYEEFVALRAYLYERHREDLRTSVLVPPINGVKQDNDRNRGLVRPFGLCIEGERGGFCRLCEQEGYALPFTVWGYYTHPVHASQSRPAANVAPKYPARAGG